MSVRKIPKNYRNVTGLLASGKADTPAQFESTLERDFLTLLEFSPDVSSFDVQPLSLAWNDDGRERRYTPDVLVRFKKSNGAQRAPLLCEVKYRSELKANWSELRPKLKAGVRHARTQGWRFKLMTETEIRTAYLRNAQFLLPFIRRGSPHADHMDLLDRTLGDLRETDVEGLLQAVCRDEWHRASLLPALWYLVGTFQFGADLQAPLTAKSRIWSKS